VATNIVMLQALALELESTYQSAVIISLWSDARASKDDALPYGQTDRRGWVGESFVRGNTTAGQALQARSRAWGSRLWLYLISKVTDDVLEMARFAAWESLQWMVETGHAQRVEVTAEWLQTETNRDRMGIRVQIYKPAIVNAVYDVIWGFTLASLPQAKTSRLY
jgi:phage gp46-like protein